MYKSPISMTVCTGATVNIYEDGKQLEQLKYEKDCLRDRLDYAERQLDHLREQSFKHREGGETFQAALLNIRLKLDQLGQHVEASEEYDFIQAVDTILMNAGFPKRELPALVPDVVPE